MDYYPFNLKHLSRSPLNFNRIPSHLRLLIIEKQSPVSVFNLPHTNSNCSALIETVIRRQPFIVELREILQKYDKKVLFDPEIIQQLFPPSNYLEEAFNKDFDESLAAWGYQVSFGITWYFRFRPNDQLIKSIQCRLKPLYRIRRYYISELWEGQQSREPRRLDLRSVDDQLWEKILAKTSTIYAIRLAKSCSTIISAFDSYIQSVKSIEMMIATGHLLTGERDSYTRLQKSSRMDQYRQDTLFKNCFKPYLWPRTVDRSITDELKYKYETMSSEEKKKSSWKNELLGHSVIPNKCYLIDDKFLPPKKVQKF